MREKLLEVIRKNYNKIVAEKLHEYASSFNALHPIWDFGAVYAHLLGAIYPDDLNKIYTKTQTGSSQYYTFEELLNKIDFPYVLYFICDSSFENVRKELIFPINKDIVLVPRKDDIKKQETYEYRARKIIKSVYYKRTIDFNIMDYMEPACIQVSTGVLYNFWDILSFTKKYLCKDDFFLSVSHPFGPGFNWHNKPGLYTEFLEHSKNACLTLGATRFIRRVLLLLKIFFSFSQDAGHSLECKSFAKELLLAVKYLAEHMQPYIPVLCSVFSPLGGIQLKDFPNLDNKDIDIIKKRIDYILEIINEQHKEADKLIDKAIEFGTEAEDSSSRRITVFGSSSSVLRSHLILQAIRRNTKLLFIYNELEKKADFHVQPDLLRRILTYSSGKPSSLGNKVIFQKYSKLGEREKNSKLALIGTVHQFHYNDKKCFVCSKGTTEFLNEFMYSNPKAEIWLPVDKFKTLCYNQLGGTHLQKMIDKDIEYYIKSVSRTHEVICADEYPNLQIKYFEKESQTESN